MDLNCPFHLTFREFNGIYGEFIYYYKRNMFCEQDVVKNFAKLTRNIYGEVLFCNKAGPQLATIKNEAPSQVRSFKYSESF